MKKPSVGMKIKQAVKLRAQILAAETGMSARAAAKQADQEITDRVFGGLANQAGALLKRYRSKKATK